MIRGLAIVILGLLLSSYVSAQNTPAGMWRTIDDRTGEVRSHVEIMRQADGTYAGFIRHVTDESRRDAVCEECPEDWGLNQPIIGLQILRGVTERRGGYRDGEVLDPEEGKVYRVRLRPIEGGRRLEVRGYVRVPLMGAALGRTQTWERIR